MKFRESIEKKIDILNTTIIDIRMDCKFLLNTEKTRQVYKLINEISEYFELMVIYSGKIYEKIRDNKDLDLKDYKKMTDNQHINHWLKEMNLILIDFRYQEKGGDIMNNKNRKICVLKTWDFWKYALAGFSVLVIVIFLPIAINCLVKHKTVDSLINASQNCDLTKGDWLSFGGACLGIAGSLFLGIIAIYQNKKANKINDRLLKIEENRLKKENTIEIAVIDSKIEEIKKEEIFANSKAYELELCNENAEKKALKLEIKNISDRGVFIKIDSIKRYENSVVKYDGVGSTGKFELFSFLDSKETTTYTFYYKKETEKTIFKHFLKFGFEISRFGVNYKIEILGKIYEGEKDVNYFMPISYTDENGNQIQFQK